MNTSNLTDADIILWAVYVFISAMFIQSGSANPVIEVLNGGVIVEVIESKSNNFVKEDFVVGTLCRQNYSIAIEEGVRKINPDIAPVRTVVGMPGLTAYFGLLEIGQPQPNETVVSSGDFIKANSGEINKIFYVCRSPPMMDAIEKSIIKLAGHSLNDIF